ncbi:MAG: TonB-dependent receptor [Paramuribaculum sp.]|nr:TonB-dependent receptor [Paramuribaculum sp.]
MKRKLLLFLTCLSLMAGVSMARTVRGVVLEAATDEPVAGATVKCKGNPTVGTSTNIDGEFTLNVPDNEKTLVVSFIGMQTKEVAITGDNLTITLDEATLDLDEVVVVGYGTTSKRKTTSSVSVIKASEIEAVPVPNVSQALAGRAAGLIVQQSSTGLDAGSSISIRGGGTPLFVIDNIISEQREFNNLNPADIESMSVLKDASATAIYGARAANGIIIVTTKRGEAGKVNVDYQFNYTLSQPADLPKKLNAYDAAVYQNMGYIYDGLQPTWSDEDLALFQNGTDPQGHPDTNWQKITMRKAAPETRHLLTITGGSERVKAYTALSYYDQNSIYRSDAYTYKRYNARTNIDVDIKEIGLRINTGLEAYITNLREPNSGAYNVWSHIQNKKPMEAAKNPMGQPYSGTVDNPLVDISEEGGYYKGSNTNVRGTFNAVWAVPGVKGLTITGIASYAILSERAKRWSVPAHSYSWDGVPNTVSMPSLSKTANFYTYYNTQLLANYNRTFGVHNVEATFGIEASGSSYDNNSLGRSQYVLDVDQIAAGPVSTATNGAEDGVQWRRASLVARLHYDFDARYLIELSMRHDGTDNLPKKGRWGTFFSGSLGWNIAEENFWKESAAYTYVNQLKIRGSYGEIGLDNVSRYAYLTSYGLNATGAYLGNKWYQTFSEGALPSPDLKWYTQRDFNIGFDFAAFHSRLSGSFDYFYKSTKGYLASPSNVGYTAPLGLSLPQVKSDGESRRKGLDFTLQYNDRFGEVNFSVGGNFTIYDERWNINPYESETSLKNPYKRTTQVGAYTGAYYKNLGYYKDYLDVLNTPKRTSSTNIMAGDLKYWDFNGDGKIDGDDQYRMGSGTEPRCNYGITASASWRGFNINMLWQGATNYQKYLDAILMGGNSNYLPVIYKFQTDIWTPTNTDALYPRAHQSAGMTGSNNFVGTDFWFVNSQYIRLKNLTLGYDFKHKLLKKTTWLSKCYLSFTGYNLLTFSPAKKWGLDPEIPSSNGYSYPVSRVYTFSLNVGF